VCEAIEYLSVNYCADKVLSLLGVLNEWVEPGY